MTTTKQLYIVSAYHADHTCTENEKRHYQLCKAAEQAGLAYTQVWGKYDGQLEQSIVTCNLDFTLAMAKHFGQKCFLELISLDDNETNISIAWLYNQAGKYFDGPFKPIEVNRAEAVKGDFTRWINQRTGQERFFVLTVL